jgi:hypothetical protein
MKLRWALLAEHASSNDRGQFLIDGTAHVISLTGPPLGIPPLYIVGQISADGPVTLVHRLELIVPDPDGGQPILQMTPFPQFTLTEPLARRC